MQPTRHHKSLSTRFAVWLAMCALLLKAAVPLLATASAELQGKTLVEVCTVYGVKLVSLDGGQEQPADHSTAPHAGGHCALNALAALALPDVQALSVAPASVPVETTPPLQRSSNPPDASAVWAARLRHGPPAIS
jgi:hypothetical protein